MCVVDERVLSSLCRGWFLRAGDDGELRECDARRWLEVRAAWVDRGARREPWKEDPGVGDLSDVVLFEGFVDRLRKPEVRAAVILSAWGWEPADIGAVLDSRLTRGRTGRDLVDEGVAVLAGFARGDGDGFWRE